MGSEEKIKQALALIDRLDGVWQFGVYDGELPDGMYFGIARRNVKPLLVELLQDGVPLDMLEHHLRKVCQSCVVDDVFYCKTLAGASRLARQWIVSAGALDVSMFASAFDKPFTGKLTKFEERTVRERFEQCVGGLFRSLWLAVPDNIMEQVGAVFSYNFSPYEVIGVFDSRPIELNKYRVKYDLLDDEFRVVHLHLSSSSCFKTLPGVLEYYLKRR